MITVRFWASARAAAGVAEEQRAATDLADLIGTLSREHGERLAAVLGCSSFLVDGVQVARRPPAAVPLPPGCTVEVLPPFAGG